MFTFSTYPQQSVVAVGNSRSLTAALNRRKNTLLVHLSLNAIHQSVWACVCVRERPSVCVCVWWCSVDIMRGIELMKPSRQTWQTCTSLFSFFPWPPPHSYIWILSGSVSAAIYAQWRAKASMSKINAKHPYTKSGWPLKVQQVQRNHVHSLLIHLELNRLKQYNLCTRCSQLNTTWTEWDFVLLKML